MIYFSQRPVTLAPSMIHIHAHLIETPQASGSVSMFHERARSTDRFEGASNEIESLSIVEDSAVSHESPAVSLLKNPPDAMRCRTASNRTNQNITQKATFPRNDSGE
jgi:hypothetical protein